MFRGNFVIAVRWFAQWNRFRSLRNMHNVPRYTALLYCTGNVPNQFIPVHIPVLVIISLYTCVMWRTQNNPSHSKQPNQRSIQKRTTAKSSANPTKTNQTPTRCTLVKRTIILHIAIPKAASSKSTHTHTCRTYTGMRLHAPGQQAGGLLVPVHTERHTPPKLWTQR